MKRVKKAAKPIFFLAVLAAACILPLFLRRTATGNYQLRVLTLAMVWAIATMSLNLILGYTGQASLAHGAFMGVGAYAFGIIAGRVGLNFWLALLVGSLLTALLGFLIGLPSLRTKGPYFAIVTLCFNVIVFKVFENWTWLSGGYRGQTVPVPSFLAQRWARYYFVLGILVLMLAVVRAVVKSLLGASLIAVRGNEDLAEAVGINAFRVKLLSLTVSCFIVGVAGALLAVENGHVDYTVTNYMYSFYLLIYLLIGGAATLFGPVAGTVGIYYLLDRIKGLGEFRYLIFGLLLIIVIIYLPRGLAGGVERLWDWIRRVYYRFRAREEVT